MDIAVDERKLLPRSDRTGHDRRHDRRSGGGVQHEMIIEAPSWTLDDRWLVLNGD
jgi:hypothetical protein